MPIAAYGIDGMLLFFYDYIRDVNSMYQALEFHQVKEGFVPFLKTKRAKERLEALVPFSRLEDLEQAFDELKAMGQLQKDCPRFVIGAVADIRPSLSRLQKEADLSQTELREIKDVLLVSNEMQASLEDLQMDVRQVLENYLSRLITLPKLQSLLDVITQTGAIDDSATPLLMQIRHSIKTKENAVRRSLQTLVKEKGDKLSEPLIVNRSGKQVLPVKATYKKQFPGVIHDISSSGATLYIEPREIVALNEAISYEKAKEKSEIGRILQELSLAIRPYAHELTNLYWAISELDFLYAKSVYSQHRHANIPTISKDQAIHLLQVRHPLLEKPVPNDLHFGAKLFAIVITGPNTGGKTLLLKTLGVTQLMAQSGLPILADRGSQVGFFDHIFVDIGDEQSIAQSLSTFSSHMTKIVAMLENATPNSLMLFDELGAGTDPQEGASLAMAILSHLVRKKIKMMATTHYPELKAYGVETDGVENASMAFDEGTLQPTYQFLQGVPGRSNAFDIAERLGLDSAIIEEARNGLSNHEDVHQVIVSLEAQVIETRRRLAHIRTVEDENMKMNHALKKLYRSLERDENKILEEAHKKAGSIIEQASQETDTILKHLHEKSHLKPHEVIDAKAKLKALSQEEAALSHNKVLQKAKKAKIPKVGDSIEVIAYGQRGVLTKSLKNGQWEAQVGLITMVLQTDEFKVIKQEARQTTVNARPIVKKRTTSPRARLDLRGKRYEEAMQKLDNFIDQALLNNLSQVDIIHGIGTGVIRDGVTRYLRNHKHVADFGYAPQSAGGSGCTIVSLI